MQEAQRHRVLVWINAGEAGAADHDVDFVLAHVGPQPVPKQLDGALVAIGFQHAGATQLHEVVTRSRSDKRRDVVFALRVEAERPLGHLLTQHAIRADYFLPAQAAPGLAGRDCRLVNDEEMVADGVVGILVATAQLGPQRRHGRHLFVEDLVAQPLCALDVAPAARQTYLEITDLAVDFVRLAQREDIAARVAQSAKRQKTTGDRLQLGTASQSAGHAPRGISHLLSLSPTLSPSYGARGSP